MSGFTTTPEARADLNGIWDYTAAHWDSEQADRYTELIIKTCGDLAEGSIRGRQVEFVRAGYFKYSVGSHVAFYRFLSGGMDLVRVLHKQMDATRHLST
ncbi:MAG: type II toxin-antitoxin system RelE/ParE family toxin [Thermomicrobiales bacterium]